MPTVYAFVSPKGGSGKTITAITLATVLSALGKSVVLIDADASTNGLTLFYLDRVTGAKSDPATDKTLVGSFDQGRAGSAVSVEVAPRMNIVPATFVMSQTEEISTGQFRTNLERLILANSNSDFVFLDAQAGTDIFAQIATSCADEIVIVSEYDPMSVQGIERLRFLFADPFRNKRVTTLFNKVLPEFATAIGDFLELAGYLTPIPWDADVVRAYVRRRSPVDMDSGNTHTLAIMQTAVSLFGRKIEKEVAKWTATRADLAKRPIELRLADVEGMVEKLEKQKVEIDYRQSALTWMVLLISPIVFGIASALIYIGGIYTSFRSDDRIGTIVQMLFDRLASDSRILSVLVTGVALSFFILIYSEIDKAQKRRRLKALEKVSLDLELQRLREERSRLVVLAQATPGELVKTSRKI